MVINLTPTSGVSFRDYLTLGSSYSVAYGYGGNDTIEGKARGGLNLAMGGKGEDGYIVNGDMVISDSGGHDYVTMLGISWSSPTSHIATIDNRHLVLWDTASDTSVIVLDWLDPGRQVELYHFNDVSLSWGEIAYYLPGKESFIGDIPWEGLGGLGLTGFLSNDANDTINFHREQEAFGSNKADAEAVGRLYEAGLGRKADIAGLNFWYDVQVSGVSEQDIVGSLLKSAEFTKAYGNAYTMTNADLVEVMYENVLGRASDSAGAAFWISQLQNGFSREGLLIAFADSAENVSQSDYLHSLAWNPSTSDWYFA
ncbi:MULTISPECIES: DUF4214 domain-containing protein [unclassified Chelatococcus]|uniref:DUF4214 domain-containing protein n=1 Tax=unclassified Chelatococcus TaxID=2638111 RepID=UPI001BCFAC41|nr:MULTISPECIES: DUF4214 domain-containing protein [unclassified Chelatococcus]MBS7696939.1 DUF4214 domain-containing protein [Chelatococcus sp. YT9]MBX3555929.1 DUF4214 domain-containing protein [Chelatococcus sp.]